MMAHNAFVSPARLRAVLRGGTGRSDKEETERVSMSTRDTLYPGSGVTHHAINTSKPNIARIYDYLLGGKDNFAADRDEAERMLQVYPLLPAKAWENRLFLARAVKWAADQGVRQFMDIGSGLPTVQNTHQIAQAVDPACRIAYVDYDPVVMAHARALLRANGVIAIECDLRDPAAIFSHPDMGRVIRLGEPLGLILAMVLHFFEAQAVSEIMRTIVRSIAPGSYVVISVGSGDEQTGGRLASVYTAGTLYNHAPGQIARFFDGLELVGPGLVDASDWHPLGASRPSAQTGWHILAGVGRKS
jgi:SAM-dependent methyltransferase